MEYIKQGIIIYCFLIIQTTILLSEFRIRLKKSPKKKKQPQVGKKKKLRGSFYRKFQILEIKASNIVDEAWTHIITSVKE